MLNAIDCMLVPSLKCYTQDQIVFLFVELPDDLFLGSNTRCYVDDLTIPITDWSIEPNINGRL